MGRSFGFSDAYAKRERYLAQHAEAHPEREYHFDGRDGDPRGNGRDEWVANEEAARKEAVANAPELERLASKADVREFKDARGRTVRLRQDVSPGLDGQNVTIHGERATFELPEPEIKGGKPTGDTLQRFITESGQTGVVRAVKVGPGRHRLIVEPRRRYF